MVLELVTQRKRVGFLERVRRLVRIGGELLKERLVGPKGHYSSERTREGMARDKRLTW